MKNEDIFKNINRKINSGEIKMKSQRYYSLVGFFGIGLAFLLFLLMVFFVNIQFHAVSQHMAFQYLTFKGYGINEFIMRAPIINFMIAVLLLLLSILLFLNLKNFYKLGRLKILIMFFIFAGILGFLINMSGINEIFEADPYLSHLYLFKGTNDEKFIIGWLEESENQDMELVTKDTNYILDLTALSPIVVQNLRPGECLEAQGEVSGFSVHVEIINPSTGCNFPQRQ